MKRIKLFFACCVALALTFLYVDTITYYYGFGIGFFNSKLPSRFSILFAGSDLGDEGMVLEDNLDGLSFYIIKPNDSILVSDSPNKIMVKKFVGYWFNGKTIVAKVRDDKGKNRYIETYEEMTNSLYPKIIQKEMRMPPDKLFDNLRYIDLDRSLNYFKRLRIIKNLIFLTLVIMSLYCLRLIYLKRKSAATI